MPGKQHTYYRNQYEKSLTRVHCKTLTDTNKYICTLRTIKAKKRVRVEFPTMIPSSMATRFVSAKGTRHASSPSKEIQMLEYSTGGDCSIIEIQSTLRKIRIVAYAVIIRQVQKQMSFSYVIHTLTTTGPTGGSQFILVRNSGWDYK